MALIEKTIAFLSSLTEEEVRALPPAHRGRFADLCRHWAKIAERPPPPKTGVISLLERGDRAH